MRKISLLLFVITGFISQVNAQFNVVADSLKGLRGGDLTCTDFDSDGDVDVLTFGDDTLANIYSIFYRNDSLEFAEFEMPNFPNIKEGAVDWADYNNDGLMDLALIGWSSGDNAIISQVLTYDSGFTETNIQLPSIYRGSIDWGDYNNDGLMDLLVVGQGNDSYSNTKLFENRDSLFFEVEMPEVIGQSFGDASWVDYDGDGRLDFIVTGVTGQAPDTGKPETRLYRNTEEGFKLVLEDQFVGVYESSIDWADADNDGDPDLLLTGLTSDLKAFTGLYINDSISFHIHETSLPNVLEGFAKWGDYDNDSDLDILITGDTIGVAARILNVFANDDLQFTKVFEAKGISQSSGAWVDFDKDGYLDIIVNGQQDDFGLFAGVYINELEEDNGAEGTARKNSTAIKSLKAIGGNEPPSIPANLRTEIKKTKAILEWDASTDDNTLSKSLSYGVYLFKEDDLLISSMSNSEGARSILEQGNAGLSTFFKTDELENGNYTWAVQAIDNSFVGSSFSEEGEFSIGDIVLGVDDVTTDNNKIVVYPNPVVDWVYVNNNEFNYQVFDLTGKVVLDGKSGDGKISLQQIKKGVYLLKISTNDKVVIKKLIKS